MLGQVLPFVRTPRRVLPPPRRDGQDEPKGGAVVREIETDSTLAFTSFGIPSSVFKSAAGPPRAASESSPRSRGPSADPDAANLHNARLASADSSDAFRPSLQPSRGFGCQLRRAAANDKGRQGEGRRAYLNRRISTKDFANLRSPKSRWARTATDRPAPGTSAIAARQSWRGVTRGDQNRPPF